MAHKLELLLGCQRRNLGIAAKVRGKVRKGRQSERENREKVLRMHIEELCRKERKSPGCDRIRKRVWLKRAGRVLSMRNALMKRRIVVSQTQNPNTPDRGELAKKKVGLNSKPCLTYKGPLFKSAAPQKTVRPQEHPETRNYFYGSLKRRR